MKKIFLSLPMSGRSDEEIKAQIEEMKAKFLLKNPFDKGEEIVFFHNFKEMEVETNTFDPLFGERKTPALYYLGRAINKMAYCDAAYFGKGWMEARGCIMEWQTCMKYGIPRYIQMNEEEEKEGYCSVCAIKKGSPTCEKCKHKEDENG